MLDQVMYSQHLVSGPEEYCRCLPLHQQVGATSRQIPAL